MTTPATAPAPTHGCVRCGRPVPVDVALCDECNPLELAQPSATQLHGTGILGIILFVVLLAVLGRAAISGTGPFAGTVNGVVPVDGGLAVTLIVTNRGSKEGATTCRIIPDTKPVGGPQEIVQTPPVPAGGDVQFTATVTRLGTTLIGVAVECQSP
jgi:hypothetical protein